MCTVLAKGAPPAYPMVHFRARAHGEREVGREGGGGVREGRVPAIASGKNGALTF